MTFDFNVGDVIRIFDYHHVVGWALRNPSPGSGLTTWSTACGRFDSYHDFERGQCAREDGHPTCLWCVARSYGTQTGSFMPEWADRSRRSASTTLLRMYGAPTSSFLRARP